MEDKNANLELSKKHIKTISIIGLLLTIVGIADTIYLTIAHFTTVVSLVCPDKGIINCGKVTSSSYSEIFGIPVSLFGLIFFIGMFVLQLPYLWRNNSILVKFGRLAYSILGIMSVFWFVYVEIHILNAICLYCTLVHILTFGLFVTTLIGTSLIYNDIDPKSNSIKN
jgi:uncharacterized membrane protein